MDGYYVIYVYHYSQTTPRFVNCILNYHVYSGLDVHHLLE